MKNWGIIVFILFFLPASHAQDNVIPKNVIDNNTVWNTEIDQCLDCHTIYQLKEDKITNVPFRFSKIHSVTEWISLSISIAGGLVIILGILYSIISSILKFSTGCLRNDLANCTLLGLQFLIAAEVVSSIIIPDWKKLGTLAVTVAIRIAMEHLLEPLTKNPACDSSSKTLLTYFQRKHKNH